MVKRKSLLLFLICTFLLVVVSSIDVMATSKNVKLTVWSGYPEMAPFYKQVIEDYQKEHPNVTISFLTHPLREYEQKLAASIPANTAADITETHAGTMRKFIQAGLLSPNPRDVDSFLKSGVFNQFFVDLLTEEGHTYGLPFFQGRAVLFWNRAMFREAGLPGAPTTWEEVIEYSQKLAQYDKNGELTRAGISLRKSGGGSGLAQKWAFWLYPAGGNIVEEVSPGKWRNGYNNDAGREALRLYIDLLYKYKVDDYKVKADTEGFALQTHAMFTRESYVVGYMKEHAPDVEFDTAPLPAHNRAGTICIPCCLYVTESCKNPEQAWDFIKFMLRPEYQKLLLSEVGWFPCLEADYEEIFQVIPQYRAFVELPPDFDLWTQAPIACFDEIQTRLAERLIDCFMDKTLVDNPDKIAKVLAEAAQETDDILRENGLYADK